MWTSLCVQRAVTVWAAPGNRNDISILQTAFTGGTWQIVSTAGLRLAAGPAAHRYFSGQICEATIGSQNSQSYILP